MEANNGVKSSVLKHAGIGFLIGALIMILATVLTGCGGKEIKNYYVTNVYQDGGTKIVYVYPDAGAAGAAGSGGASGAGGSAGEPGADAGEDAAPESGNDAAPDSTPGEDAGPDADAGDDPPTCVTDEDCAKFNAECFVHKCQVGLCFLFERDEDGDGHSLCGGGNPDYVGRDCDDFNANVHPGAAEVCGDFVDQNCNGEVDEGCWALCEAASPYLLDANALYEGCCARDGTFPMVSTPTAGMLIRADGLGNLYNTLVYYLGSDGKRYVFPTIARLASWFGEVDSDGVPIIDPAICGKVHAVTATVLAGIQIGGNVTYRPGTFLTGIATNPKRYAVAHPHTLRLLAPSVAVESECGQFAGTCYKRILIESDAFFVYDLGADITSANPYDVAAELAVTIEQDLGIAP